MSNKERLLTPLHLLLALGVGGGVLHTLYPDSETVLKTADAQHLKTALSNPLQTAYARTLVAPNVEPVPLLQLATSLSAQHAWEASENLLTKLPGGLNPQLTQQTEKLHLLNRLDAYYADNSTRNKQAVQTQLKVLATYPQWNTITRTHLAKYSLDFGLPAQAIQHYSQLAQQDAPQTQQWLILTATTADNAGLWDTAADYWQRVHDLSPTKLNVYTYHWLESAIKAGRNTEATNYLYTLVDHLPETSSDLQRLAHLSLKLGKPALASTIYQQLANVDPESAQTWHEKAAHWSQTVGAYHLAANALTKAHNLSNDEAERLSLQYRSIDLWVAAKQPHKAALALKPLLDNKRATHLTLPHCLQVAYLAEKQQQHALASSLWTWVLAHSDDRKLWQHVALWQESRKQYTQALATWQQIETRFGVSQQTTLMRIQVLWRAEKHQQALRLARQGGKGLYKTANRYQRSILTELNKRRNNA